MLANPEAFTQVQNTPSPQKDTKQAAKVEEKEEESDEDMGFGLFD